MIVPMKKVTLYALKQDKEALLAALQRCGELMVVETEDSLPQDGCEEATEALKRTRETLRFVGKNAGKKGLLTVRPEVEASRLLSADPESEALQKQAFGLERRLDENSAKESSLKAQSDSLAPWLPLDTAVESLKDTRKVAVFTGNVAKDSIPALTSVLDRFDAEAQFLGEGLSGRAAVLYCMKDQAEEMLSAAKAAGFEQAALPRISGVPVDCEAKLTEEREKLTKERDEMKDSLSKLAAKRDELELLCDQQATVCSRLGTPAAATEYTFRLCGWAMADRAEKIRKAVESVTDAYALAFEEPTEDDQPPTVEKNSRFVTPFETITDMFSRPDPRELDPNPIMAPWYWIIFGMMMADAGYGLIMALFFGLFLKLKKPRGDFGKLVKVLLYASITTAFWGVMFGAYFGAEWFPPVLFIPLDEPVSTLILCLGIGVLHIFSGMAMAMANAFKAGDWQAAIFDNLSWIIMISGLGMLFVPSLAGVGKIMALTGAGIVLFTAGRSKKGIKKVTSGILGLYSITGHVSDILSYSRILALALSSGVVAMVFNLLAGMVQGSIIGFLFSIFIYLLGHAFNLAMGLLSAYVHSSRLQYIEFFGKFYQGNGHAFTPLSVQNKYVDLK